MYHDLSITRYSTSVDRPIFHMRSFHQPHVIHHQDFHLPLPYPVEIDPVDPHLHLLPAIHQLPTLSSTPLPSPRLKAMQPVD